jgi:uncharacterized protein (DUF1499 family)
VKSLLVSIVVLAIAVGIGFAVLAIQSRSGKAPGLAEGELTPCGDKPNCVSSMARVQDAHHIDGIKFEPGDADSIWAELTNVVVELGGKLTHNAPPYLAATFSSDVFGFVDDVEFLISNDSGTVHVRSASRVGYSDLEVNRKRVEAIRARLAVSH